MLVLVAPAADALKYAPVEHHIKVDPAIPPWHPAKVDSVPEEEVSLVGADVMDEITLGWIKLYRKAYPLLSVTMEAKSSGSGAPGLISGKADMAPVGRELLATGEAHDEVDLGRCGRRDWSGDCERRRHRVRHGAELIDDDQPVDVRAGGRVGVDVRRAARGELGELNAIARNAIERRAAGRGRARAERRGRVQAARHLWLPARPHR